VHLPDEKRQAALHAGCPVCIWSPERRTDSSFCKSLAFTQGGEEASAPFRAIAAEVCRHAIDSIIVLNPDAKIIVMGDLMMIR